MKLLKTEVHLDRKSKDDTLVSFKIGYYTVAKLNPQELKKFIDHLTELYEAHKDRI